MKYNDILLIDDDDDDQEIFVTAISEISQSIKCNAISNSTTALSKLREKDISPDVIFLDLNMPIMNGFQFLKEIKQINDLQIIPIIIYSTTSHIETIKLTKELGAHDFITKPYQYNDLLKILKKFLE